MSEPVICAICGKPIAPDQSRYVDVNVATKQKRQVHTDCKTRTAN